jgi:NIMA (never in mitosis gene a)-related kinase
MGMEHEDCRHSVPGRGYAKIKDIGAGSYGKAVLVQDREAKLYVMKIIDMSRMDSKQRKDAANEVKVLSSLKHPYIVSYRESFTENKHLAIVMDYADGGDLHERIKRTRKAMQTLSEDKIVRWFTEATLALKYMHDKHVLHRDLKSQNLFLTSQDRLRIGDFGISKVLENTAAFAKTTIGTPYYLSPEICMEKPYSFSSDIWALGCILYEMAALRVPFDASSLQALVQKITRGPAPVLPSAYSPELRQLCSDLLHREQSQRPLAPEILQRSVVQAEIRRMLREEQAKNSSKENEENRENRDINRDMNRDNRRRPSEGSQVSRRPSEGALLPLKSPPLAPSHEEAGDLSARHRNCTPQPLKGCGANLCENGARMREPSENREPRPFGKVPSVPPLPPRLQQHHGFAGEPLGVGGPSRPPSSVRRRF